MDTLIEAIPTWALCYLFNSDVTGLTDEEIRMIDNWLNNWEREALTNTPTVGGNAQPYFSHCPLFGLPAEVEDCNIIFTNDNPSKI